MITITTTQLNNRGEWSGGIEKEGKGRVDKSFLFLKRINFIVESLNTT
jgi:hypothetical protein